MAIIKVSGQEIDVDIQSELEAFDWQRAKWSSDKLIAASPFRYDRSPSFFVNIEGKYAGYWGDSGAYDDDWKSGNFVKLLSFLRNETFFESEEYLCTKYLEGEIVKLNVKMKNSIDRISISRDIIKKQTSPYLSKRGISDGVQAQAGIGSSRHYGFVAIPWYHVTGEMANVKYRSTKGKMFFYEKGGHPIKELVYGANLYVKSTKPLILCEAEIDALSWRTASYNAVAVGGVAFTKDHANILKRLPYSRLIVAGDNDKAGQKFNRQVISRMNDLEVLSFSLGNSRYKDANEVLMHEGIAGLVDIFENNTKSANKVFVKLQK